MVGYVRIELKQAETNAPVYRVVRKGKVRSDLNRSHYYANTDNAIKHDLGLSSSKRARATTPTKALKIDRLKEK